VDPLEYDFVPATEKPRNIGFISRMCYVNGLDIAVDAFLLLRKRSGFDDVKFVVTGGSTPADHKFISGLKKKIRKAGLTEAVDFHEGFEGEDRKAFFSKVSLASVPVRNGEAFGIYLPELMASGIPIVQPALGAFPEIVELSGGGITYSPNTPETLAEHWARLLSDPVQLAAFSHQARKGVELYFDIKVHAAEMVAVYNQLIAGRKHAASTE